MTRLIDGFVVVDQQIIHLHWEGTPDTEDSEVQIECPNEDDTLSVARDMSNKLYLWCASCKWSTRIYHKN